MGLATAKYFASQGAHIVIASRSHDKLNAALNQIKGKVDAKPLDFTDEEATRLFFQSLGNLDHLILMGAGLPAWGKLQEIHTSALENAFKTKFYGYFFCAKYAIPYLRKDGSILFTIGGAARSAIPGTTGVAAVNGAIMSMAFTLAKELAPIRVNILSPGLVDTPAYNWMSNEEKEGFLYDRCDSGRRWRWTASLNVLFESGSWVFSPPVTHHPGRRVRPCLRIVLVSMYSILTRFATGG